MKTLNELTLRNIKYLIDNDCNIWTGDAYKKYSEHFIGYEDVPNQDWFIEQIKNDFKFAERWGDLGPVYGKQWRSWKFTDKFINGEQVASTRYQHGDEAGLTYIIIKMPFNKLSGTSVPVFIAFSHKLC